MSFVVVLLPQAVRDVDGILAWLTEATPQGANAWFRRWLETIELLEQTAESCGVAPESSDHAEVIRQVFFKTRRGRPYRALFVVRDDKVFVLHVRGSRQNLLSADDLQLPPD